MSTMLGERNPGDTYLITGKLYTSHLEHHHRRP